MNENVERVLAELDGFRMCGQMDYDAYSRLHDSISEFDELLKTQELPPVKPEKLEERTTEWLDKMTAQERLEEIAAILDDWDGYRTAKGLGMLINEVWAYALYPVKAQEPRILTPEEVKVSIGGPIYFESRGTYMGKTGFWILPALFTETGLMRYVHPQSNYYSELGLHAYGKVWRCWTARPSDEQREAVKWE